MRKKNCSGATLIEVVVAFLLLTAIMLYGAAFFVYGGRSNARGREKGAALQLAAAHVEYLKTIPCSSIPLASVATTSSTETGGMLFTRNQVAYVVPNTYTIITESITWASPQSAQTYEVDFHTIISTPLQ
jgi:Tfp pilus assembly protein PilV